MDDPLRTTLGDAVAWLRGNSTPYALVGGLAASLRGQPRVTADVDMVILVDVDRALAMAAGLHASPFMALFEGVEAVITRSFILPLRHRVTGVKLDLALGLSGFEQQLVSRAETLSLASCLVAVATAEDLIVMKALAGRPQDELDLEGIVVAQGDRLDWGYCQQVAADLGEALGQDVGARVRELHRRFTSG